MLFTLYKCRNSVSIHQTCCNDYPQHVHLYYISIKYPKMLHNVIYFNTELGKYCASKLNLELVREYI